MAIITMPRDLACARGCALELINSDTATRSDPSGSIQARSYGVPVWGLLLVSYELMVDSEAGAWKALGLKMRGLVNHLEAFDPTRPVPLGSLRGTLTLALVAPAGTALLDVTAGVDQSGRSLVPGDLLQVGTGLGTSQLVMVTAPAVVNGSGRIVVEIEPPLRAEHPIGTPVTWDYPRVYLRRTDPRFGWQAYGRLHTDAMRLPLIESL